MIRTASVMFHQIVNEQTGRDTPCAICPFCSRLFILDYEETACDHVIKVKGDFEPEEVVFGDGVRERPVAGSPAHLRAYVDAGGTSGKASDPYTDAEMGLV